MTGGSRAFENDLNLRVDTQQRGQVDADASVSFPTNEKENTTKENNVAKIKVVVCWLAEPTFI